MSTLLDHPDAQALLADATVSADDLRGCADHLDRFLDGYDPCFYRVEQHDLARVVLRGTLSGLDRKTAEPIAAQDGRPRKPVQHFVGAGAWDDQAVLAELRRHVAEARPDPDAVLVIDPRLFPNSGSDSCGVTRPWCGRWGKVENYQVGVFAAYVSAHRPVRVDHQVCLCTSRGTGRRTRRDSGRPTSPTRSRSRSGGGSGWTLVRRCWAGLAFAWVAADDELGRASGVRVARRADRARYVLEFPSTTLVRDPSERPAVGWRRPPWRSIAAAPPPDSSPATAAGLRGKKAPPLPAPPSKDRYERALASVHDPHKAESHGRYREALARLGRAGPRPQGLRRGDWAQPGDARQRAAAGAIRAELGDRGKKPAVTVLGTATEVGNPRTPSGHLVLTNGGLMMAPSCRESAACDRRPSVWARPSMSSGRPVDE